jgi:arabinan endo-1,5-alpha-L-arabinosidase
VIAGRGREYGPGHFGLLDLGDGVEKFSMHYESDMDRGGRSVLGIAPLLWRDGWPVAGENLAPGTYEIQSERSGGALELATDFVRIALDFRRSFASPAGAEVKPIPNQTLAQDSAVWPSGAIAVDLGDYMIRPHQQWTITPVAEAGGAFGAPYYRIGIAGTDRVLAATTENTVVTRPAFTGAAEQLWRIDQLTDGTYRIMPKQPLDSKKPLALVAIGASTPVLTRFNPAGDGGRWTFRKP